MSRKLVQIGMDDIDSPDGRCTTHFASIMAERLREWNVEWVDYPNLIRLNPSIPYRTRGNGAVALRFIVEQNALDSIIPIVEGLVQDYVEKEYPNINPGIVPEYHNPDYSELLCCSRNPQPVNSRHIDLYGYHKDY